MAQEMSSEQKQKIILIILGVFGGVGLLWVNLISPYMMEKDQLEMQFIKSSSEKQRLIMYSRQKQSIEDGYTRAVAELQEQSAYYIPEQNGVFRVKEIVRELCDKVEISKDSFELNIAEGDKQSYGAAKNVSIKLSLNVGYHTLGKFLELLETEIEFANISSVKIDRNEETGGTNSLVEFSLPILTQKAVLILKEFENETK